MCPEYCADPGWCSAGTERLGLSDCRAGFAVLGDTTQMEEARSRSTSFRRKAESDPPCVQEPMLAKDLER